MYNKTEKNMKKILLALVATTTLFSCKVYTPNNYKIKIKIYKSIDTTTSVNRHCYIDKELNHHFSNY